MHFGAEGTAAVTTPARSSGRRACAYERSTATAARRWSHGDLLIVSCDGFDEAFVVALDKRTGKTRWRTSRRQPWSQAYTTPLVIRVGDRDQVVSVGAYHAAAYDPANGQGDLAGQLRGRVFERAAAGLRPRPGVHHDRIPAAGAAGGPAGRDGRCDRRRTSPGRCSEARRSRRRRCSSATSSIIVNDAGIASCLDARTGTVHWQQRLGGNVLGVARSGRRPHLFPQRGRRDDGHRSRHNVPRPRHEPVGRPSARLDGRQPWIALRTHGLTLSIASLRLECRPDPWSGVIESTC